METHALLLLKLFSKSLSPFLFLSFCNSYRWMLYLNFFTIIAHHFLSLCTFGVFNQISNTSVELSVSLIIYSISKKSCFQENPNLFYECNIIFCVSEGVNCKFLQLSFRYLPFFLQTLFFCLHIRILIQRRAGKSCQQWEEVQWSPAVFRVLDYPT